MTIHMINREKLIIEVDNQYLGFKTWNLVLSPINDLLIMGAPVETPLTLVHTEADEEKTRWVLEAQKCMWSEQIQLVGSGNPSNISMMIPEPKVINLDVIVGLDTYANGPY